MFLWNSSLHLAKRPKDKVSQDRGRWVLLLLKDSSVIWETDVEFPPPGWKSGLSCCFHPTVSEVAQSCPTLCDPMDSSLHQAPPSMGFSRQEYWSGLLFPSPGNLQIHIRKIIINFCNLFFLKGTFLRHLFKNTQFYNINKNT